MANQYHDETGRFCSKAEMGAALNRLAEKQDMAGYIKLRDEYDSIEKTKNDEVKDILKQAIQKENERRSGYQIIYDDLTDLISEAKSTEALAELYEAHPPRTETEKLAFLKNDQTSEDIRLAVLAGKSHGEYAAQYYALDLSEQETKVLLNKTNWRNPVTGSNSTPEPKDLKIYTVSLMQNSKLSQDQLKKIVSETNQLHVWEAYKEAGFSWDENDEERIYNSHQDEAFATEYYKAASGGIYETVLSTTRNTNLLTKAIEDSSTYSDDYHKHYRFAARPQIASNPNLTPALADKFIGAYRTNIHSFNRHMAFLTNNPGLPAEYRERLVSAPPAFNVGEPTEKEKQAVKDTKAALKRSAPLFGVTPRRNAHDSAQAQVDSYPANYRRLVSRFEGITKARENGEKWSSETYENLEQRIKFANRLMKLNGMLNK